MDKLLARDGALRMIVEAASAAPSIHNTQPWLFHVVGDDLLELHADPDRALWVADPEARGMYLSCGAALFNIRAAIRMNGFNPLVWPLPDPTFTPLVLAAVRAEPARPPSLAEREIYDAIWRRHTDRGPFSGDPLPEPVRIALEQAADFEFASLRMLSPADADEVVRLAAKAGAELAGDVEHQAELREWITTGRQEDGIPAAALPPPASRQPAPVRQDDLTAVAPLIPRQARDFEQMPNMAVLTTARDEPADWLRAGQAMQRILLTATVHGVSASFLYQPIELRDMRGPDALEWPWRENPQIIFRFGYGQRAVASPRRPLEEVLTRTGQAGTTTSP